MVTATPAPLRAFRAGPLEVVPAEYQVRAEGVRVGLTVREFEVFLVLAERVDRVVTREEIYGRVWRRPLRRRDRSVDTHVRRIRGKLGAVSPDWTYVHTHFGIGYRLAPEPVTA